MPVRTVIERGPKGKKVVAFAVDWPGWSRGARTAEDAIDVLERYRERYRPIVADAGLVSSFDRAGRRLEVVEDRVGTGSTDFWGISFSPCGLETEPMAKADLDRKLSLLQAAWSSFDGVAGRVSPEMQKGPRGGGRDRDQIVGHTLRTERLEFAKRLGLRLSAEGDLRDHRETYVATMRAYNAGEGKRMRSWNLPFLIRHSAFHVLDHAWEMQDKDLGPSA